MIITKKNIFWLVMAVAIFLMTDKVFCQEKSGDVAQEEKAQTKYVEDKADLRAAKENIGKIKKGITPEKEILEMFGRPFSTEDTNLGWGNFAQGISHFGYHPPPLIQEKQKVFKYFFTAQEPPPSHPAAGIYGSREEDLEILIYLNKYTEIVEDVWYNQSAIDADGISDETRLLDKPKAMDSLIGELSGENVSNIPFLKKQNTEELNNLILNQIKENPKKDSQSGL